MHPRARRLLRWALILLFFIAAPAVILTTAGYRYNFEKGRLERTGVMVVDTDPAGATIFLDGAPQKARTPARLTRLTPGTYRVRIEKAGYWTWEKDVPVASRSTAFLDDVSLYRAAAPTLEISARILRAGFSDDARYLAAVTEEAAGPELRVYDLLTRAEHLPYRAAHAEDLEFSWAASGDRLLMSRTGAVPGFFLWSASDPARVTELSELTGVAMTDAFWSDEDALFASDGARLYRIDPGFGTAEDAGPSAGLGIVAGGRYYGVVPEDGERRLVRRLLRSSEFETLAILPGGEARRLPMSRQRPAYAVGERLIVLQPGESREVFESRGRDGVWQGPRFLYWNDLELRAHDASRGSDELLTRLSTPMDAARWDARGTGALFVSGGKLRMIEVADRHGRAAQTLAIFTDFQTFQTETTGDAAWVVGTIGSRSGVWRLEVR